MKGQALRTCLWCAGPIPRRRIDGARGRGHVVMFCTRYCCTMMHNAKNREKRDAARASA